MKTINDIFCTPEQGKRLAELVPSLTSVFVWARIDPNGSFDELPISYDQFAKAFPKAFIPSDTTLQTLIEFAQKKGMIVLALTFLELRDLAYDLGGEKLDRSWTDENWGLVADRYEHHVFSDTAPEIAQWLIERLEATP